ncbi:hypothetical protein EWM64_g4445 [Hericium alpestre]|uniref:Uncharacterized protein n=1 Tax=Hericium alpestre TaxID=135208 RepID=A0A4Y9ZXH4_9AGAM|nr:hypothetical protein EWM64_g4445 [Hericium alpestre]
MFFDLNNLLCLHLSMAPLTIRIPAHPSNAPGNSAEKQKDLAAPAPAQPTSRGKENVPLPSAGWLCNPAWVDGGVNLPCFYPTAASIQDAIQAAANAGVTIPWAQTPIQEGKDANLARDRGVPVPAAQGGPVGLAHGVKAVTVGTAEKTLVDEMRAARGAKMALKKKPTTTTKFEYIKMDSISHVDFIKAFLRVHNLDSQYSPGVHAGLDFRLWWTGSNGGKAGVLTIENARDFALALVTLMQKNQRTCAISVEFDMDSMDGYRICKLQLPVLTDDGGFTELVYKMWVPNVDHFSNEAQLHGPIILELKQKWFWAATIAAHDVTKHDPSNNLEFDGACDGRLITTKPCGHSGPQPALTPATASQSNMSQLLMAAILSNLSSDNKRRCSPSPQMP